MLLVSWLQMEPQQKRRLSTSVLGDHYRSTPFANVKETNSPFLLHEYVCVLSLIYNIDIYKDTSKTVLVDVHELCKMFLNSFSYHCPATATGIDRKTDT